MVKNNSRRSINSLDKQCNAARDKISLAKRNFFHTYFILFQKCDMNSRPLSLLSAFQQIELKIFHAFHFVTQIHSKKITGQEICSTSIALRVVKTWDRINNSHFETDGGH